MSASSLSKTGSPKPRGTLSAITLSKAPHEFPSFLTESKKLSKFLISDSFAAKKGFLSTKSQLSNFIFNDPICYDEKVIKKIQDRKPKKVLNFIIQILEKNIPASNWKKQLQSWGEKEELPFSVIMQSLRLAIVGNLSGPDILVVCGLLEKEVILKRLKKLINYLNN